MIGSVLYPLNKGIRTVGRNGAPVVEVEWDLFIACGQSNAVGMSSNYPTDVVSFANGASVSKTGTIISPVTDPMGQDDSSFSKSNGSAYPAFCQQYYTLTGRKVMILHRAIGFVSSQQWLDNQQSPAISDAQTVVASLIAADVNFNFRGVLWWQGESDGGSCDVDSGAAYQLRTEEIISGFFSVFAVDFPDFAFYIFKIKQYNFTAPDDEGWVCIRAAQENIAADNWFVNTVTENNAPYNGAGPHHPQSEYNTLGQTAATNILNL